MNFTPFITVEGPIGVGKTSLSKAVADEFGFPQLKEIVDENPFLGKFYNDIEEWSFQTEMFFLCNRYKQLEDINKYHLKEGTPVVADYHILKNMIFAQRTLHSNQFTKYKQIYSILTADMPQPNVIIYLTASLDTLLNRIEKRGRSIEQNIDPQYLQTLVDDYEEAMERFIEENPHIPVLKFNGDNLDFVNRKEDLQHILSLVKETLHQKEITL